MKFYIRKSWGCIVGHGIPGTDSCYVTVDGRYRGEPREFTADEAQAYMAEHAKPGATASYEIVVASFNHEAAP